jgi:trans-aconitate methyltransferase
MPMREWNAGVYHRVSNAHVDWGTRVLARLPLDGDELVLDIGCGTGRLTEQLLERLPDGRAIGVDLSSNMLTVAREYLAPRFGSKIQFVFADAGALPFHERADAVFSTATFHWVLDHPLLFRSIHDALRPGGRLVAQCGGGPNMQHTKQRCRAIMMSPAFARYFGGWREPWEYADAPTTAERLTAAGFTDIRTSVEPAPLVHPDAATYKEFVTTVICRPYLAQLPEQALRDRFIDELTEQASRTSPPFELDYWRLNIDATKPRSA